jgi:hypothetical protein
MSIILARRKGASPTQVSHVNNGIWEIHVNDATSSSSSSSTASSYGGAFLHTVPTGRVRLLVGLAVSMVAILTIYQKQAANNLIVSGHSRLMAAASENNKAPVVAHIGDQTLSRIAPSHPKWNDQMVHEEFKKALKKIEDAPIEHHPFDHFAVPNLFSDEFYKSLMEELPPPDRYKSNNYAGTDPMYKTLHVAADLKNREGHIHIPQQCHMGEAGTHDDEALNRKRREAGCWLESVQLHDLKSTRGRTLTVNDDATSFPLWVQAFRFVHSTNFTLTMYKKFATETGIPQWKQKQIAEMNKDQDYPSLRNSAALRIEPDNYHLSPHVDRFEKLVTWQFFHPESDELRDRGVGTMFYEIEKDWNNTFEMQEQKNPPWLDYSFFKPIKEMPVIPNYFFSFTPNNRSWHGAAIDPSKLEGVSNRYARRTFLGFITTKYWKYHHFQKDDWASTEYTV